MNVKTISGLLIVFGLIMIFWGVGMDTTVSIGDGYKRVNNLGLMSQQQNMLILGGVAFLAGIILFALHKLKQTNEEKQAEQEKTELRKQQAAETVDGIVDAVRDSTKAVSSFNFKSWLRAGAVAFCYLLFIDVAQEFFVDAYFHKCNGYLDISRDLYDQCTEAGRFDGSILGIWGILFSLLPYATILVTIYYVAKQKSLLTVSSHFLTLHSVLCIAAVLSAVAMDAHDIKTFPLIFALPIALSIWGRRKLAKQANAMG